MIWGILRAIGIGGAVVPPAPVVTESGRGGVGLPLRKRRRKYPVIVEEPPSVEVAEVPAPEAPTGPEPAPTPRRRSVPPKPSPFVAGRRLSKPQSAVAAAGEPASLAAGQAKAAAPFTVGDDIDDDELAVLVATTLF